MKQKNIITYEHTEMKDMFYISTPSTARTTQYQ
jgi:hypothetical protein